MNLEQLDRTGCNNCFYQATDKKMKNEITFWYNQCDEDGACYSLNAEGLPENHKILAHKMVSSHEELEALIFEHFENVKKIECSCGS